MDAKANQTTPRDYDSSRQSSTVFRILIVDDDASQRILQKEILASPGYHIEEAASGEEALKILHQRDFDVILLDKLMPGMSGDNVCVYIRTVLGKNLVPIIMVTATDSQEELAYSLSMGANDFIRKPYAPLELQARVKAAAEHKRSIDQLDNAESLLFALARMVEAKDEHTGDHCSRLKHMATLFGEELGLESEQITALRRGGVLHDIGKLGIPDCILMKKGPLSDEEWVVMRQHAVVGARLCSPLQSMQLTVPIIRSHHERWNGSGYPDGLAGEEIPLLARIFQLLDIYDALSSVRPYKKAFPRTEVVRLLEEEIDRGWREPELGATFLDFVKRRADDLILPPDFRSDKGAELYQDIRSTGVLDWSGK